MYFESHTSHQSPMQHTTRDVIVAIAIVVSLILLMSMCDHYIKGRTTDSDTTVVERKVILPPDTVFVDKIQAKIIYKKLYVHDTLTNVEYAIDTVLTTKPFIAYMDTTINCKELKLEYHYPENTFQNLNFVSCPDTVIVHDTVIATTMLDGGQAAMYAGYGFVGGFILGMLGK